MGSRHAIILFLLPLGGCDAFYGAQTRTTFTGLVDVGCVSAALTSVPDVGHVTYQRTEDRSTEILPKQRKVLTVSHIWLYGEGAGDILQIDQTPDGWDYWNSRSRINVPVPHDEIVRFLPLMQKTNKAIQLRCGLRVGDLSPEPVGATKSNEL